MTPAARVQAAIELLDQIIDAAKREGAPADRLISGYFRERRYAGSKDRRAVRELVYQAIRICGEIPGSGRSAMLALAQRDASLLELFDGSTHGPAILTGDDTPAQEGAAPQWLCDRLTASGVSDEGIDALQSRATLDCRVNTLKSDRASIELPEAGEHLASPCGLRFAQGTQVEQWSAYREGLIEVQDHGSQWICNALNAQPGETVIDLCAGAGGKTLALAAAMENRGRLIATDSDRSRLARLGPRAERAGVSNCETRLLNPKQEVEALADLKGQADLVLVDAPCSGVGTWRRKPEAKWRLTPERLDRFALLQDHLLNVAAYCTKSGGRIAFVTCSLLDGEGAERIDQFLERNPNWNAEAISLPIGRTHGQGYRLEPFHDGTDGFFVAIARSG